MQRTLPYILEQGACGHHALFDHALIRAAFGTVRRGGRVLDEATAARAAALLDALGTAGDLPGQRAVIADAPSDVQTVFVQLYFDYLARYMHRRGVVYH